MTEIKLPENPIQLAQLDPKLNEYLATRGDILHHAHRLNIVDTLSIIYVNRKDAAYQTVEHIGVDRDEFHRLCIEANKILMEFFGNDMRGQALAGAFIAHADMLCAATQAHLVERHMRQQEEATATPAPVVPGPEVA